MHDSFCRGKKFDSPRRFNYNRPMKNMFSSAFIALVLLGCSNPQKDAERARQKMVEDSLRVEIKNSAQRIDSLRIETSKMRHVMDSLGIPAK